MSDSDTFDWDKFKREMEKHNKKQDVSHTGWRCPSCGRINAPWKAQCDCYHKHTYIPVPYYPSYPEMYRPYWYDWTVTCYG